MWGMNQIIESGGFVMIPLLLCSLLIWGVIFERLWRFRQLGSELHSFQLEATHRILRGERDSLKELCATHARVPTSRILMTALDRLNAKDAAQRVHWREAMERKRLLENQELKSYLWILGTIGTASPFIGLLGTVIGILRSFGDMAATGAGGFAVVAAGISKALVATAAGIAVAIVAVMAYNAFQNRWGGLVLKVRLQTEELAELVQNSEWNPNRGA